MDKKILFLIFYQSFAYTISGQVNFEGQAGYEILYSNGSCNCINFKVLELGTNLPLEGVSVLINGKVNKKVTNKNGELVVSAIPLNSDIVLARVGFIGVKLKQIKSISKNIEITIYLPADKKVIDD